MPMFKITLTCKKHQGKLSIQVGLELPFRTLKSEIDSQAILLSVNSDTQKNH